MRMFNLKKKVAKQIYSQNIFFLQNSYFCPLKIKIIPTTIKNPKLKLKHMFQSLLY